MNGLIDRFGGLISKPPSRIDSLAVHRARLAKQEQENDTEAAADALECESVPIPPGPLSRLDSRALHRARIAKSRQEREGGMSRLSEERGSGPSSAVDATTAVAVVSHPSAAKEPKDQDEPAPKLGSSPACRIDSLALHRARLQKGKEERDGVNMGRLSEERRSARASTEMPQGKGPGGQVKADELIDKLWGAFSHPPTRIDSLAVHKARLAAKKDCKGDTEEEAAGSGSADGLESEGSAPLPPDGPCRKDSLALHRARIAKARQERDGGMGRLSEEHFSGPSSAVDATTAVAVVSHPITAKEPKADGEPTPKLGSSPACRIDSLALHSARLEKEKKKRESGNTLAGLLQAHTEAREARQAGATSAAGPSSAPLSSAPDPATAHTHNTPPVSQRTLSQCSNTSPFSDVSAQTLGSSVASHVTTTSGPSQSHT